MTQDQRLWGGRFSAMPDASLVAIARIDRSHDRLVEHDLAGCCAHARALWRSGLLNADERESIIDTLAMIGDDAARGDISITEADEDVHSFIERELVARLGALGGKLRAGRSRNDQAANDLRLVLRAAERRLRRATLDLIDALCDQAGAHSDTLAPGFTHLQPAQPISLGHQFLAHAQALLRDCDRFADWTRRADVSPLGAAALAGSGLILTPEEMAADLGYARSFDNSIDAVGSRDHVAEFLFVCAMLGVDLSRLAEEVILWASSQFGWIALDDAFSTGSSIMPQKRNPDIAELTRGRAARLIGALTTMLTLLKGLPFAYNRDFAEDKRAAFDAIDGLEDCLPAMTGLVRTMRVNVTEVEAQATDGFTLATEIADWLAGKGTPFREAHEVTGLVVRACDAAGCGLNDLTADTLAALDLRLAAMPDDILNPRAAIARRCGKGGTAPDRVREQLAEVQARAGGMRHD